jgi:hypothetical protein
MQPQKRRALLATLLLFAGVITLFVNWKISTGNKPASHIRTAPDPQPASAVVEPVAPVAEAPKSATNPTQQIRRPHLKTPASELSQQENAEFQKKFTERIKPAVEHWCKVYAGHVPFRPQDLTATTLRERFGDDPSFYDYGFVINGTTLSVVDYHGDVFVAYLMSPAAGQLLQLPKTPEPPKPPSVTKDEILRLLKADSGQDLPSNEIAMRPTAYAGAMNGGISVDVGEGVNTDFAPLFKYSMVFGPDGNLACYMRKIAP